MTQPLTDAFFPAVQHQFGKGLCRCLAKYVVIQGDIVDRRSRWRRQQEKVLLQDCDVYMGEKLGSTKKRPPCPPFTADRKKNGQKSLLFR